MSEVVFFSELQEGKHDRGTPRKHYKDQLKGQLAQLGISHQSWQQVASDQDSWRSSVRKASREFEAERHEAAKGRCRRQKELAASQSSLAQTFTEMSKVQEDLCIKNWTLQPPRSMQKLTINLLVCGERAIITNSYQV